MKEIKRVLIMAGGTGGHVFPGLALAYYLRQRGIEVHWLGTPKGMEALIVPEAGFPFHAITIGGIRGKGIKTRLLAPLRIVNAIYQSQAVIQSIKPDVVVGLGGFVSGPGGVASWLCNRPLVIHEQNAIAGFTNKMLKRFAKKVLAGFPHPFKTNHNVLTIGNPVRSEMENLPVPEERFLQRRGPYHLLVLGGSLGAQALNEVLPNALAQLNIDERPMVIHQTGKQLDETANRYRAHGLTFTVDAAQAMNPADCIEGIYLTPFIKQIAPAYAWADVVLCRAGALTVAELCTVGLGAIFIPYPFAVDDHQTANAQFMVTQQAALCIQQAEVTAKKLSEILRELALKPEKRLKMAQAAYSLRQGQVVEKFFAALASAIE